MRRVLIAMAGLSMATAACGSTTSKSAGSGATTTVAAMHDTTTVAMHDVKLSAAFCASATAIGSLSQARATAMADAKASTTNAMKMFEDIASKVLALKVAAPAELVAAIDAVAAQLTLEAKAEEMTKADGTGAATEMSQLTQMKAADDAAAKTLIDATKAGCNVDLA